jgi:hypothetical protein
MTTFNSAFDETRPFSDMAVQIDLTANVAQSFTIAGTTADKYRCQFSFPYNGNVWVGFGVAATTPSGGTPTECDNIELRPDSRYVRGGDVLSFLSSANVADVGFSLLQLPA